MRSWSSLWSVATVLLCCLGPGVCLGVRDIFCKNDAEGTTIEDSWRKMGARAVCVGALWSSGRRLEQALACCWVKFESAGPGIGPCRGGDLCGIYPWLGVPILY